MGLFGPKQTIPGVDLAGQVEAVGPDVTGLAVGDEVFGPGAGAFAEYVCVAEELLVRKPANVTFEQAAAAPVAGLTALQALRDRAGTRPGHRVLVVGASGGVGTFAVQVAKWLGAEVTAVCSTRNVGLARSLGADHVIDYQRGRLVHSGQKFDVILSVAGAYSVAERRRVLAPDGTLVGVGGPKHSRLLGPASSLLRVVLVAPFSGRQRLTAMISSSNRADLALLRDLLEAGTIAPAIERTYPLPEVPEAVWHIGRGRPRAKNIIRI